MWDDDFLKSTDGLIKPDYFTNEIEQLFVELALQHYSKYHEAPSKAAWFEHLKEASKRGRLRSDQKVDAVNKLKDTMTATVRARQWLHRPHRVQGRRRGQGRRPIVRDRSAPVPRCLR